MASEQMSATAASSSTWFECKRIYEAADASGAHGIDRYFAEKTREIRHEVEMEPHYQAEIEDLRADLEHIRAQMKSGIVIEKVLFTMPHRRRKMQDDSTSVSVYTDRRYTHAEIVDLERKIRARIEDLEERIRKSEFAEMQFARSSQHVLNNYMTVRAEWNRLENDLVKGTLDAYTTSHIDQFRDEYRCNLETITDDFVLQFIPDHPRAVRVRNARERVAASAASSAGQHGGCGGGEEEHPSGYSYICDGDESGRHAGSWPFGEGRCQMRPARKYNYRRVNHMREFLRQQQGDSNLKVPVACLDSVRTELRKRRISVYEVGYVVVRNILKKMENCEKLVEHAQHITRLLNPNYRPLCIEPEHQFRICQRFMEIEAPFEAIKKQVSMRRKNFLSYPFCAYKICELEGYTQYLPHFKLLKSNELLVIQDRFFEAICKELGWPVERTIGRVDA